MGKRKGLVITEKPSVAQDIAAGLDGEFKKAKNQLIGEEYIITWTAGHCLELKAPHDYDPKYKTWNIEHLPIFPEKFEYNVISSKKDLFNTIKSLIQSPTVDRIILATDAEREGELIGQLILDHAKNHKPVFRMWTSKSLSKGVVKAEFKQLKPGHEYRRFSNAAKARQHADWLVGINCTRVFSLKSGQRGKPYTVGRVQTPTLAMIVNRQRMIDEFRKEAYWTLKAGFSTDDGEAFEAHWVGTNTGASDIEKKQLEIAKTSTEMDAKQAAHRIVEESDGRVFIAIKERKSLPAPMLFSLTTLQREANRLFGFTLDETLDLAQQLYETYKATTYPRTEAEHLENEQAEFIPKVLDNLEAMGLVKFDREACTVKANNKRIFDTTKLTDHFALIPTGNMVGKPPSGDLLKLYGLICTRFISAFYPPYQYDSSRLVLEVGIDLFQATGIEQVALGWRSVYGNDSDPDDEEQEHLSNFPCLEAGDEVWVSELEMKKGLTKPPRPYTDRSLVKDMCNAKKFVDDPDYATILNDTAGLGQPATRAEMVKNLVKRNYITRKARNIHPTPKAFVLIDAVGDEQIAKVALSAMWEQQLDAIASGARTDVTMFMGGVRHHVEQMVDRIKEMDIKAPVPGAADGLPVGVCPECGEDVIERELNFGCTAFPKCKFSLWKNALKYAGKSNITANQAKKLLSKKHVEFKGLKSKAGNKYDANGVLDKHEKFGWQVRLIFEKS